MESLQAAERLTVSATDWIHAGSEAHAVQFYEHEGALAYQLSGYVGSALVTGNAAVVIATARRRDSLRERLALRGLDIEVARREGRYVALDAEEVLPQFLGPGSWPDPARFRAVVAGVIDGAIRSVESSRPHVAAFGEMVAVLCASGRYNAAIRLEELWNEFAADYPLSLVCAYPMSLFKANSEAAVHFMKVCAQHSHVFSADRRSPGARRRHP